MKKKFVVPYLLTGMTMVFNPLASSRLGASEPDFKPHNMLKSVWTPESDSDNEQDDSTIIAYAEPQLTGVSSRGLSVIYTYNNGTFVERKSDGTRAWRNNNPGNLRYYQFAKDHGAVGEAGGFAVFPDEESGMAALTALLHTDTYQNMTVYQAIRRYAVKDVTRYVNQLRKLTGVSPNTKLRNLTPKQLQEFIKAIRTIEGWVPGTELTRTERVVAQNRNAQKTILWRAAQHTHA